MTVVTAFIYELICAANEVERLTEFERARLLRHAAAIINAYREQTGLSETPATDSDDIVQDLIYMAEMIDLVAAKEIGVMMLDAAEAIKSARALSEIKNTRI